MFRLFVHRLLIHLLGLAGLLGCGLSLAGLGLVLYGRIKTVLRAPAGGFGPDTPDGLLFLLDGFKEAGTTFLLSATVFVLCEIALGSTHRRPADPTHDRPPQ